MLPQPMLWSEGNLAGGVAWCRLRTAGEKAATAAEPQPCARRRFFASSGGRQYGSISPMRIFVVAIRWKRKTARLWLSVALCLCLASAVSAGMADAEKDLPALDRLEIFQPGEPSILYTVRDEPFATLAQEFRIAVPLSQVPKLVRQAVLDIEDTQFYEHGAVSLKGMARATLRNLTSGKVKEGGSTITQQLAKSLFLSSERTWSRKVKEIQIAAEIEQRYTKDKILEMYLNAIYFGSGAYGIEAASRTYFGKSISQVNLP
ncbi:MAG: hypothetical protein EHM71_06365, partial [Zetaproteobacteria bacterium]